MSARKACVMANHGLVQCQSSKLWSRYLLSGLGGAPPTAPSELRLCLACPVTAEDSDQSDDPAAAVLPGRELRDDVNPSAARPRGRLELAKSLAQDWGASRS